MTVDAPTVRDLIERTKRHLMGSNAQPLNTLQDAITDSADSFVCVQGLDQIDEQTFVSIDDETMWVKAVDRPARLVSVTRGMNGSLASAHLAGAMVEQPTLYPRPAIRDALVDEVRSWPDDIFMVDTVDLTLAAGETVIDLPVTDLHWVLEVRMRESTLTSPVGRWPTVDFDVYRHMPVSEFVSGTALSIHDQRSQTVRRVRVLYARSFDTSSSDDGDNVVTDWGLHRECLDIPTLGAAARLLIGGENARSQLEAAVASHQAEQVPPTTQIQTALAMHRLVVTRLGEESMRLHGRYPRRA